MTIFFYDLKFGSNRKASDSDGSMGAYEFLAGIQNTFKGFVSPRGSLICCVKFSPSGAERHTQRHFDRGVEVQHDQGHSRQPNVNFLECIYMSILHHC